MVDHNQDDTSAMIGRWQRLSVEQLLPYGALLSGGVLLPTKSMPSTLKDESKIEVFVYQDGDGQLKAITTAPKIELGQCAYLSIVDVNKMGAFADWGVPKDLLIPFAEQRIPLRKGQHAVVYLALNRASGRLIGSTKLNKHLPELNVNFKAKQPVRALIVDVTDLGYKVVIDHSHIALIHHHDVYQKLRRGQIIDAYIKEIRPDGKINVTTHIPNKEQLGDLAERILADLKENEGVSDLTDKSDPEVIRAKWQVSKGSYKKALGKLYKERKITISPRVIQLVKE